MEEVHVCKWGNPYKKWSPDIGGAYINSQQGVCAEVCLQLGLPSFTFRGIWHVCQWQHDTAPEQTAT